MTENPGQLFRNDTSQKERAEVLRNDRRNQTLHGRASSDLDLENSGRFAKPHAVIGVDAPDYPKLPASSPWHHDPVPPEEPIGVSIDAHEPVGEIGEIQASLDDTAAKIFADVPAPPRLSDAGAVVSSSSIDALTSCDDALQPQHRLIPADASAVEPASSLGDVAITPTLRGCTSPNPKPNPRGQR
jgi:hypothetical protein